MITAHEIAETAAEYIREGVSNGDVAAYLEQRDVAQGTILRVLDAMSTIRLYPWQTSVPVLAHDSRSGCGCATIDGVKYSCERPSHRDGHGHDVRTWVTP